MANEQKSGASDEPEMATPAAEEGKSEPGAEAAVGSTAPGQMTALSATVQETSDTIEKVSEAIVAEVEEASEKKGFFSDTRRLIGIGAILLALIIGFLWPAVPEPHVALGGEPFSTVGWLTNSLLHTFIVDGILIILALAVGLRTKLVPTGIQNFMEMVIEYFYGLAEQIAGKAARTYFPWIMTIFLFVIVSNWTGFFPGVGSIGVDADKLHGQEEHSEESEQGQRYAGKLAMADGSLVLISGDEVQAKAEEGYHFVPILRAPTADLNVTFALAIVTMFMVQFWGFKALGFSYLRKFFTFAGTGFMRPINSFVGILELVSEISRILSFGFRLFGNIFAGEIVLATMAFLGAFILPLPFYLLETFVGFVQALVFAMLALVFFTMATVGHHDDHAEESH